MANALEYLEQFMVADEGLHMKNYLLRTLEESNNETEELLESVLERYSTAKNDSGKISRIKNETISNLDILKNQKTQYLKEKLESCGVLTFENEEDPIYYILGGQQVNFSKPENWGEIIDPPRIHNVVDLEAFIPLPSYIDLCIIPRRWSGGNMKIKIRKKPMSYKSSYGTLSCCPIYETRDGDEENVEKFLIDFPMEENPYEMIDIGESDFFYVPKGTSKIQLRIFLELGNTYTGGSAVHALLQIEIFDESYLEEENEDG